MVVVLAVQPVLGRLDIDTQFALVGIVDWIGHLATGVVLIALLRPPRRMAAAILVFSVVIDVDHLPLELGSDILTAGTPRPYTHSLLTLLVVLAARRCCCGRRCCSVPRSGSPGTCSATSAPATASRSSGR